MEKAKYPRSHLYSWGRPHPHRDPCRDRPPSPGTGRGSAPARTTAGTSRPTAAPSGRRGARPRLVGDGVWRFERLLRAIEYHEACRRAWYHRPLRTLLYLRFHLASIRLGFTIPPHVFGPGLSIAHRGTIVVNSCARVGANCRLHACTNIGSRGGSATEAPTVGDNVYIGPGAVLYGPIAIADNIAIGANSVVNASFHEPNITIAGAPARKVRDAGTTRFAPPAPAPRSAPGRRAPARAAPASPDAPPGPAPRPRGFRGAPVIPAADNIARLIGLGS